MSRHHCVCAFPAGTEAPAHNGPQPYEVIVLLGKGEVVTSDGEARRLHSGEVLFCNDLTGKGHVDSGDYRPPVGLRQSA